MGRGGQGSRGWGEGVGKPRAELKKQGMKCAEGRLGLNPDFAARSLCDLGQITSPLWASVFLTKQEQ